MNTLSIDAMTALYNSAAARPVKSFKSTGEAEKRLRKLCDELNLEVIQTETGDCFLESKVEATLYDGESQVTEDENATPVEPEAPQAQESHDDGPIVHEFDDTASDLSTADGVLAAFKARAGTNRHRLLSSLLEAQGDWVSVGALANATYGDAAANSDKVSALSMVVKGADTTIKKLGLPFEIKKDNADGVVKYALRHLEPAAEQNGGNAASKTA